MQILTRIPQKEVVAMNAGLVRIAVPLESSQQIAVELDTNHTNLQFPRRKPRGFSVHGTSSLLLAVNEHLRPTHRL